jgi:hypothetical protein
MRFYLGTHVITWLWKKPGIHYFITDRQLRKRKSLFPAFEEWGLDSGGFTELSTFGAWQTTPQEYAKRVRRYNDEIGKLAIASIQDWMCEPFITAKTGKTIAYHQERTVDSYIELMTIDNELPWIPILQGWELDDYLRHIEMYNRRGIPLDDKPLVGVGSVCRRQHTDQIKQVFTALKPLIPNMHGFGVKTQALKKYANMLTSSDSMAWSYAGRYSHIEGHTHKNCANCYDFAAIYYDKIQGILKEQI